MSGQSNAPFPTSIVGIRSIQTGYLSSLTGSAGAGEDATYTDITIAAVDMSKSFVVWQIGNTNAGMTCRLVGATTLRIAHNGGGITLAGRWQVIEGI